MMLFRSSDARCRPPLRVSDTIEASAVWCRFSVLGNLAIPLLRCDASAVNPLRCCLHRCHQVLAPSQ